MLISLFSLRRKDTEMRYFRITEISENSQKYHLFLYFRVFSPCEKKEFGAVCNKTKYKTKNHFCKYCLQCFSGERVLIEV